MTNLAASATSTVGTLSLARLGPALAATVLGLVILFGTGFAPQPAAHNAAHDTRHAFAFPCH